jgi:hypothetical protein
MSRTPDSIDSIIGNDFTGKLHKYVSESSKWTGSSMPEGRKLAELVFYTICTQVSSQTESALRLWLKHCAAILCVVIFVTMQ